MGTIERIDGTASQNPVYRQAEYRSYIIDLIGEYESKLPDGINVELTFRQATYERDIVFEKPKFDELSGIARMEFYIRGNLKKGNVSWDSVEIVLDKLRTSLETLLFYIENNQSN